MTDIFLVSGENLNDLLQKIKEAVEGELEVADWQKSFLSQNPLNFSIVENWAQSLGKKVANESVEPPPNEPFQRLGRRFPAAFFFKIGLIFLPLILIGAAALAYYYLPQGKLTIVLQKSVLNKTLALNLREDQADVNAKELTLPVKKVIVEEKDEKIFPTTGKILVGEKAKGRITIQNWTDQDLSLPVGTVIKSEAGDSNPSLIFELDQDAVLPRQTFTNPAPGQKLYQAGTATLDVTADAIGNQYNVAIGTTFTVADKPFSQVTALAANNFSGGKSSEVKAFSASDRDKATASLSSELSAKAKTDLLSKLLGDQVLIQESLTEKVVSANFNKEIGAPAENVTLTLTIQLMGLTYSQSQLRQLVFGALQKMIPEGLTTINENSSEIGELQFNLVKAGVAELSVKITLIPKIDLEELKKKLVGGDMEFLHQEMEKIKDIKQYTYVSSPKIPSRFLRLPFRLEKLKIELKAE